MKDEKAVVKGIAAISIMVGIGMSLVVGGYTTPPIGIGVGILSCVVSIFVLAFIMFVDQQ